MSLAETQQIYELLVKIDELLANVEVKTQKLEREAPKTAEMLFTITQVLRVTWKLISLLRRMGLPEDATRALQVLSSLARSLVLVNSAFNLIYMGTPYGMAMGLLGLGTSVISLSMIASPLEGY